MFLAGLAKAGVLMPQTLAPKLELMQEFLLPGDALSVAWDEMRERLYVGSTRGEIYQIDLTQPDPTPTPWQAHLTYVSGLALAAGHLVSVGSDHQMSWWDPDTHLRRRRETHPKWIRQVAVSEAGDRIATVCDDMTARVWDANDGDLIHRLQGHAPTTPYDLPSKLYSCAFSPSGQHLATADQLGYLILWDISTGEPAVKLHGENFFTHDTNGHGYGGVRHVAFSPDGAHLAACGNQAGDTSQVAGSKSLLHIYDWKQEKRLLELADGGNFFYERVAYHRSQEWIFAAAGHGSQQKLVFIDPRKGELASAEPSPLLIFDLCLDQTSTHAVTAGRKGKQGCVAVWKVTHEERPPAPA